MTTGAMICEGDAACCRALTAILTARGFTVLNTADTAEELLQSVAGTQTSVILIELALAGMAGLRIVSALGAVAPGSAVIVLSPFADLRGEAIKAGAHDLVDPRDLRDLERCLDRLTLAGRGDLSSPASGNGTA